MDLLLRGTGLSVASSDERTILLRASAKSMLAAPMEAAALNRPPPGDLGLETVTVTGSSIRGVAPIGSNLVSVGRDVLEKSAAINASEMTNTVPAITQSGGQGPSKR